MAARLATPMLGATGAAPCVGALVVDEGQQMLFGRGATSARGEDQAELLALAEAQSFAEGRTLYVTMEPAAHFTSFAPVNDAIVRAGIARVVVGSLDPDPERTGSGLRALMEDGVEVGYVDHPPSRLLGEGYASRLARGRPFVTLKMALSPDGMVGYGRHDEPTPLGVEALRFVERERAASDAVLSGAARAELEDNDMLVHLDGLGGRAQLRVLLAGSRELDLGRAPFAQPATMPLLVVTTPERQPELRGGIEVLALDGRNGRPDLWQLMSALAERGISRVLVEAGAKLAESFIAAELVDRLHLIETARPIGKFGTLAAMLGRFEDRIAAARFYEVDRRALGEDKVRTFERS